jgi:GT2 family glycosyltransferase
MAKIGLGVITCRRPEFFAKCMEHIATNDMKVDELIVVNDSGGKEGETYGWEGHTIYHEVNQGVAVTKNDAMKYLLGKGCDYIFLIEDDIIIKDPNVFHAYIDLHKVSGIHHFNFGYHGPANKKFGQPTPRLVINYGELSKIALNSHCVGAFSFYTKECLEKVGLMDETFHNVWEHVDHTLRIIQADYHPPFWWFADLANSMDYLDEIACSEENSTIRGRDDWMSNIQNGMAHFRAKHTCAPLELPNVPKEMVVRYLHEKLKTNNVHNPS